MRRTGARRSCPGVYQGTHLHPKGPPIDDLERPGGMTDDRNSGPSSTFMSQANTASPRAIRRPRPSWPRGSRATSWPTGCSRPPPRRSTSTPSRESIKRLYGIGDPRCDHFARQCLTARRLVERGVRFVQIYSGGMDNQLSWDGHVDIKGNHEQFAGETDQPVAGLLADLDQRGLLDETLVIWGGEFGRLPDRPDRPEARPRPQSPRLHGLAGRRRRQGGRQPRRDRRDRLRRGRRSRPHQRPARHDPAPPRHRSRAADLHLQRPAIPPDRRRRQGGAERTCLRDGVGPRSAICYLNHRLYIVDNFV